MEQLQYQKHNMTFLSINNEIKDDSEGNQRRALDDPQPSATGTPWPTPSSVTVALTVTETNTIFRRLFVPQRLHHQHQQQHLIISPSKRFLEFQVDLYLEMHASCVYRQAGHLPGHYPYTNRLDGIPIRLPDSDDDNENDISYVVGSNLLPFSTNANNSDTTEDVMIPAGRVRLHCAGICLRWDCHFALSSSSSSLFTSAGRLWKRLRTFLWPATNIDDDEDGENVDDQSSLLVLTRVRAFPREQEEYVANFFCGGGTKCVPTSRDPPDLTVSLDRMLETNNRSSAITGVDDTTGYLDGIILLFRVLLESLAPSRVRVETPLLWQVPPSSSSSLASNSHKVGTNKLYQTIQDSPTRMLTLATVRQRNEGNNEGQSRALGIDNSHDENIISCLWWFSSVMPNLRKLSIPYNEALVILSSRGGASMLRWAKKHEQISSICITGNNHSRGLYDTKSQMANASGDIHRGCPFSTICHFEYWKNCIQQQVAVNRYRAYAKRLLADDSYATKDIKEVVVVGKLLGNMLQGQQLSITYTLIQMHLHAIFAHPS